MQHANAPLTAHGRLRMVLLVEEEGFTLGAAAAACNVAEDVRVVVELLERPAGFDGQTVTVCGVSA